jgi:hypothetical protein
MDPEAGRFLPLKEDEEGDIRGLGVWESEERLLLEDERHTSEVGARQTAIALSSDGWRRWHDWEDR